MNAFLEISMQCGQLRDAAHAEARLVEFLLHTGRHDEAASVTVRLSDLLRTLGELRRYRQEGTSKQADEHNGRAIRQLSVMSPHPFDSARSAVQHLAEAQSADPAPCWYALNQASLSCGLVTRSR